MLGYFSSSADVGIYNAALPTAQLIRSIPAAFATFFPVISGLYTRNRMDELRKKHLNINGIQIIKHGNNHGKY